jgi:hypothetical protein
MKTKLFSLHTRDLIKGLILATITAGMTLFVNELQMGSEFDKSLLKRILIASVIAFFSYIIKNFLTNSQDEFATKEPK